jgi:hypothetical protein
MLTQKEAHFEVVKETPRNYAMILDIEVSFGP